MGKYWTLSDEIRGKMSDRAKGRRFSQETREKISKALSGRKLSEEHIKKLKEKTVPEERKKRISATLKNRQIPQEQRDKMIEALRPVQTSNEYKKRHSVIMKKVLESFELRKKWSEVAIKKAKNPEYIKKLSDSVKNSWGRGEFDNRVIVFDKKLPNNKEAILLSILNKEFPGVWAYVGNGKKWINRKNPDFMSMDGKNRIIELYGDYWHKGQNPQDRVDVFKKYGYNTLVIWEKELNNINGVINKVDNFMNK